jgi:hypothetical protein
MGKLQHSQDFSKREWIAKARAVRLEEELERRGIHLNGGGVERRGPCLWCGGFDRLAVNVSKQQWSCSACQRGGDIVALVQHLDRVDFLAACRALTRREPPGRDETASDISTAKCAAQPRQAAPGGQRMSLAKRVAKELAGGEVRERNGNYLVPVRRMTTTVPRSR